MLAGAAAAAGLAILSDALAMPRRQPAFGQRSVEGTAILAAAATASFGAMLALSGSEPVAVLATAGFVALLTTISNIKCRVLGEPLVFSDFALIAAVFRHPQFYLAALRGWQLVVLALGLAALIGALGWFSGRELAPRLTGAGLLVAALAAVTLLLRSPRWDAAAQKPDPARDVAAHGLVATLLVHWRRWRKQPDPQPCRATPLPGTGAPLVVIVQSESFTDPALVLGEEGPGLPGLARARALASAHGRLHVPGFGAYTMRTEYGVLFGRSEAELGLRRFDPFLTAAGEASYALPNRLKADDWTCLFLHPHDLAFYGRDRLMPLAGFDRLLGVEACEPPLPGAGRYVTDAALGDTLLALAREAEGATLIYAVTIENHGPWPPARSGDSAETAAPYRRALAAGDRLLARLIDELPRLSRPVILCFFGDHRPSIPGVSEPAPERHTPYVLLRFDAAGEPQGVASNEHDCDPAGLHHAILAAIASGPGQV